jgi:hypothetical protein
MARTKSNIDAELARARVHGALGRPSDKPISLPRVRFLELPDPDDGAVEPRRRPSRQGGRQIERRESRVQVAAHSLMTILRGVPGQGGQGLSADFCGADDV